MISYGFDGSIENSYESSKLVNQIMGLLTCRRMRLLRVEV